MPCVSIIIPVYNVEQYLEECLESAVNQTLKNIEIIAVNDGSTDNSLSILERYKAKYNNFKILNQNNQGLSSARNTGLKVCSGKYVYFLDSDDFIELDTVEYCYRESEKHNLDIVTFDAEVFFDDNYNMEKFNEDYSRNGKISEKIMTGEDFYVHANYKGVYKAPVWLNFFNRKYLQKNNLYFYDGILHEDEIHTMKSYVMAKKIKYIPKKFFHRRIRNNSIMTSPINIKRIEGNYTIAEEAYKLIKELNLNEDTIKIILLWIKKYYSNCIRFCDTLCLYEKRNFIKNKIFEKSDIMMVDLCMQLDAPALFYL